LPGSKRAVGNGFDQPLIGAVDQRWLQIERPQANPPSLEFRILLCAFQACASNWDERRMIRAPWIAPKTSTEPSDRVS
jgi:hypothetical protein